MDTPNGAILGLQLAARKDFDPTFAGSYKVIYYQKTGAATGLGNVESGTPNLGNATLTVAADGRHVARLRQQHSGAGHTRSGRRQFASLRRKGQLTDPCYGLFTFHSTTSTTQQGVFVAFQGRVVLFLSFTGKLPQDPSNTYDYFYGRQ